MLLYLVPTSAGVLVGPRHVLAACHAIDWNSPWAVFRAHHWGTFDLAVGHTWCVWYYEKLGSVNSETVDMDYVFLSEYCSAATTPPAAGVYHAPAPVGSLVDAAALVAGMVGWPVPSRCLVLRLEIVEVDRGASSLLTAVLTNHGNLVVTVPVHITDDGAVSQGRAFRLQGEAG